MVANRIGADRLGDILQFLQSQIIEDNVDFAANLPVRIVGDANATGLCNAFKARCDVDAVAEDIIVIDDYVADMNPDSEFDPQVIGYAGILCGHPTLDLDCAAHSIDRAGKL